MVELFYTEHGLPIDKDKTYDYANRYQIAYLPANFDGNNYEDRPNDRLSNYILIVNHAFIHG